MGRPIKKRSLGIARRSHLVNNFAIESGQATTNNNEKYMKGIIVVSLLRPIEKTSMFGESLFMILGPSFIQVVVNLLDKGHFGAIQTFFLRAFVCPQIAV